MAPTVYLVSGANRGIGLTIVTQLAAREDTIVFAGARSLSSATALHALSAKYPGKLHPVQLTSANREDNEAAIATVKELAGRLDVLIANAGISSAFVDPLEATVEQMQEHFEVNALVPLVLFQAAYPLLRTRTLTPKLVIVSSCLRTIETGSAQPVKVTPYGASKAAVNWIGAKIWHVYPEMTMLMVSPGRVATDMYDRALPATPALWSMSFLTPEQSAGDVLRLVDDAERGEKPKMVLHDGSVIPW